MVVGERRREGARKAAAPIIIHHSTDYRDIPAAFAFIAVIQRVAPECRESDTSVKEVSRRSTSSTPPPIISARYVRDSSSSFSSTLMDARYEYFLVARVSEVTRRFVKNLNSFR